MQRRTLFAAIGVVAILALAGNFVQTCSAQENRAHGYLFAAPGGTSPGAGTTMYFGAGGEGFIKSGLAAGGDIGYLGSWKHMGDGFGLLNLNGSYHFLAKDRKVTPFVTTGYSLGFRGGHFNAVNFGGGVNIWVFQKSGLRLEFRDVYQPTEKVHFVNMRIGWTFR